MKIKNQRNELNVNGFVYRTTEEQIAHLTEKHVEQLGINAQVQQQLAELGIAANLGGYNLVRFAFEKSGTFYKVKDDLIETTLEGDVGDYYEISSGSKNDIPAYGYLNEDNEINISFAGDFQEPVSLAVKNISKGTAITSQFVTLISFSGTSLNDYDPNQNKKQLFNVLNDLGYNSRTQYVSFDLNRDGVYNFVYLGATLEGKDGRSVFACESADFEETINQMTVGDLLIVGDEEPEIELIPEAMCGDIYEYISSTEFELRGNIRGKQGIQGVQGVQGLIGDTGNGIDRVVDNGISSGYHFFTIYFTDTTVEPFTYQLKEGVDGSNGNGIASIVKQSSVGLVDTYLITFTNGNTFTYTVTNGKDGESGIKRYRHKINCTTVLLSDSVNIEFDLISSVEDRITTQTTLRAVLTSLLFNKIPLNVLVNGGAYLCTMFLSNSDYGLFHIAGIFSESIGNIRQVNTSLTIYDVVMEEFIANFNDTVTEI